MSASSPNTERVVRTELIIPEPSEALANLLGTDIPTDELPPLWHWIHLLEKRPTPTLAVTDTQPLVSPPRPDLAGSGCSPVAGSAHMRP